MNLADIKRLIEIFNNSQIAKLSLREDNFELKLDKSYTPSTPTTQAPIAPLAPLSTQVAQPTQTLPQEPIDSTPPPSSQSNSKSGDFITSPMVGTFYHRPSPEAAPYVAVGDTIKKGQTIGIIEAMKIMNEIEAEFDCKILSIETDDGQPVEYGSHLIKVEKL
ncbi:acetyl-CoA carboxylase biotin carboxyl carrier protein [Helicobacter sp. T3_23-1059]